jgi:hypothetical protein
VEPYVDRGVDLFQTLGSLLNRLLDDSGPLEAVAVVLRIDRLGESREDSYAVVSISEQTVRGFLQEKKKNQKNQKNLPPE